MINKNWKELIKPRKIEFLKDKDSFTNAELVAEPLESGYGQTLGNMLSVSGPSTLNNTLHSFENSLSICFNYKDYDPRDFVEVNKSIKKLIKLFLFITFISIRVSGQRSLTS